MRLIGIDLARVRNALAVYLGDVDNMVATCPDLVAYAKEVEQYETESAAVHELINRIDKRHPELTNNQPQRETPP